jgi:hypothetical protein
VKFLYNLFYRLLPIKKVNTDGQLFLLTEEEIKTIRRKETIAVWLAAFFGAMGVVLLYVPQYSLPHLFPDTTITLFGKAFAVPVTMLAYSFILVIIEIMLLTFLNIWCAHEIAVATGFLNYQTKKEKDKRSLLINIGLEKKNKEVLKYGIDPLQGINRKALFVWNFFFILKATLSNMLFKILIQRLLGRYAIKAVQDFAGIPIFALWNAYGTKVILKEARVIIMGQNLVETVAAAIKKDQPATDEFKSLLYDTLQYIAVSKRDFHQNHYILTKNLFDIYGITPKENHWLEKGYYQKLHAAGKEEKEVCQLLICIGFILDGKLSINEHLQIKELQQEGLIDLSAKEIKNYQRDFLNGKGIDGLIKKYIN